MSTLLGDGIALLTALCWASAVICFRKSSKNYTAITLSLFKSFAAVVFFWITIFSLYKTFAPPQAFTPLDWFRLSLSGFLGITIADTCFVYSLGRLGASAAALVECLYTPFVMVTAYWLFKEIPSPMEFLGAGIILISVFLGLSKNRKNLDPGSRLPLKPVVIGVIGHIALVIGLLSVRDLYTPETTLWVVAYRFTIGSLLLALVTIGPGFTQILKKSFLPNPSWRYLVPGSFLGPFLATFLWFLGYKYADAARVAIFNQLSVIFIFIFAGIFLKEPITPRRWLAIIFAVVGSVIVALN